MAPADDALMGGGNKIVSRKRSRADRGCPHPVATLGVPEGLVPPGGFASRAMLAQPLTDERQANDLIPTVMDDYR